MEPGLAGYINSENRAPMRRLFAGTPYARAPDRPLGLSRTV